MSASINVPPAHQDKSDSPQYFICLKNGRWRPVNVSPGTFAVMYQGQYRVVFSRAETDEEFFAAHPETPFRVKWIMAEPPQTTVPAYRWDMFCTFKITTRQPRIYATGNLGDIRSILAHKPGTPRERVIRAYLMMLTNSSRCTARFRDEFDGKYNWAMNDAQLWRFAMHVLQANYEYPAMI